jgi:hypothetical protein
VFLCCVLSEDNATRLTGRLGISANNLNHHDRGLSPPDALVGITS